MTMEDSEYEGEMVRRPRPSGGIYSAPVVGEKLADVRVFFDEFAPTATDSPGVRLGKNAVRYTTVAAAGVGAAGLTAVVVL
jgi:hypothetical protein